MNRCPRRESVRKESNPHPPCLFQQSDVTDLLLNQCTPLSSIRYKDQYKTRLSWRIPIANRYYTIKIS